MTLTVGSLFSGIGGLELGLERAGMEIKWQVEIDGYATKVLEKQWPKVKKYKDICKLTGEELEPVDLICGGFPCQDVSTAGTRKGIDEGTRTGLWWEMLRIIRAVKPRWLIVENVPGLLSIDSGRAFGRILYSIWEVGYDAEWFHLSASSICAPHKRERVFIIAYPRGYVGKTELFSTDTINGNLGNDDESCTPFDKSRIWFDWSRKSPFESWKESFLGESTLLGVDDGIPDFLDRNRCLGNAVVPQVAEFIGKRIIKYEVNRK